MESRQTDTLTAFPDTLPNARSVAGHFGEWLQGRLGPAGPVALVTMRCEALRVHVAPGCSVPPFEPARMAAFRAALGLDAGDWPALRHDMPLGAGAGGSTASLVAYARALGFRGPPETLARACLAVEGASDPLMLDAPDRVLWASREARVLRVLAPPPAATIVGGFWGAPVPTDPGDDAFADIADLAEAWAEATRAGDLAGAARVATASAARCTALRGGADPMQDLARDLGALGVVRAHTGSARGLIFPRHGAPDLARERLADAGLTGILAFDTGGA